MHLPVRVAATTAAAAWSALRRLGSASGAASAAQRAVRGRATECAGRPALLPVAARLKGAHPETCGTSRHSALYAHKLMLVSIVRRLSGSGIKVFIRC